MSALAGGGQGPGAGRGSWQERAVPMGVFALLAEVLLPSEQ